MKPLKQELNSKMKEYEKPKEEKRIQVDICRWCGAPIVDIHYINGKILHRQYQECEHDDNFEMILENNPLDQKSQKEIQDFYFKKSNLKNKDYADMNKKYITTQGNIKAYELAYDYAMKFNKDTTNGLYFYGDVGVGKSMLAKKIAKIVIKKCYSVYFTNVVELLGNIRQDKSEFKNSTLKKCEEIDLLIIDDLGMDVPTEREKQTMQHILDNRYRNNKPIIFTSNLSIDEIENKYDSMGRVISRLRETVQDIEIKGDDERSIVRK